MNYNVKECGMRIRQLRKQNGYTQEALASKLSIDRSLLSHIEAGKRECSVNLCIYRTELATCTEKTSHLAGGGCQCKRHGPYCEKHT